MCHIAKTKNIVLILKRSIVEKRIVQLGWEPKNGRRKLNQNVLNFCYLIFISIGAIKAKFHGRRLLVNG